MICLGLLQVMQDVLKCVLELEHTVGLSIFVQYNEFEHGYF